MCALGLSKGVSQEVVRTGQEPVLLVLPYQHQAALESCCALGMFLSSRHDAPWDPSTGRGWLPTCPGSSGGNGLGSKSIFARDGRNVILITQEIKSFWILEVQIAFFFVLFCILLVWEHLKNRWQSRDLYSVKCRGLVHRTLSACGHSNKPASR